MAFSVGTLTEYVENADFPLVGKIQVSPEMTAADVTLVTAVKGKTRLQYMETDLIWQSGGGCDRSAAGTTTISEKEVEVGRIGIYENLCVDDLVTKFNQTKMKQGLLAGKQTLPEDIAKIYFDEKLKKCIAQTELSDWQSDTGSGSALYNKYNGWIKLIDAGSPVDGNTDNQTTVTLSNVVAAVRNMYLAIPDALKYRDDLVLYMPYSWHQMYCQALITANLYHFKGDEASQTYIIGTNVKLKPTYGLSAGSLTTYGRMFLTYPSNLIVALDLASDMNFDIRLDPSTNKKLFVDCEFSRGTQVYFTDHVVEFTLHGS